MLEPGAPVVDLDRSPASSIPRSRSSEGTTSSRRLAAIEQHLAPSTRRSSPSNSSTTTTTAAASDTATKSTMAARPPITCHVLDTALGRPAANIPVVLTLHNASATCPLANQESMTFASTTNADGRVTAWTNSTPFSSLSLAELFAPSDQGGSHDSGSGSGTDAEEGAAGAQPGDQHYSLLFDTEAYFGSRGTRTFFPMVQVRFVCRAEERARAEHFHVPVLLGPFGWTTYRGS